MSGDIEALADRLAGIRSWAYIAHRADWLKEPAKWAERTREVEGAAVSDALHERLTQRFVDRRTAVLVRDIGARGADALPVTVAADGEVSVGPEPIGHLTGFEFRVDPSARLADKRLLLAAAERRLGEELDRRARALVEAPRPDLCAVVEEGGGLAVAWDDHVLARLAPGRSLLEPALRTARALDRLSAPSRAALPNGSNAGSRRRSTGTCARSKARGGGRPILRARPASARSRQCSPTPAASCRARPCSAPSPHLEQADRQALHRLRVRLGPLDVFIASLLKPAAQYWRAALPAVRTSQPMPKLPSAGAATLGSEADPRGAALAYRRLGRDWLRIDLADRLASHARKVRSAGGDNPVDFGLATSVGLSEEAIGKLMGEVGFTKAGEAWRWRGRRGPARRTPIAALPRLCRTGEASPQVRIDRFLFLIRLLKSRTLAQGLINTGHIRIDGKRVEKSSEEVRVGSVVALPLHDKVRVLRVRSLPDRRGPASEARACYDELGIDEKTYAS